MASYLASYRSSLSLSDFMVGTYLPVIRFAPSGSSILRTARKVFQLIWSRILVYLASIILRQFALGSPESMISVNQHWNGTENWVRECLVLLRYPREILCVWDWFLVLVAIPRALCVCWRVTLQRVSLQQVVPGCLDFLERFSLYSPFVPVFLVPSLTYSSQILVALSL